jgi:hypothetical protein
VVFAESSDLLDRAIRLTLPRIPDRDRKSEDEFEPLFEAARPRVLGAILDAVSAGLRNYDTLKPDALPRMARSARWIAACEADLPPADGSFTAAYTRNREELNVLAVDNSPVATALLAWLDRIALPPGKTWEGSASKLHDELLGVVSGLVATSTGFPKAPNKLSGELRRLAPVLARVGVHVALGRNKRGSCVTVRREAATGDGPSASPVSPVPEPGDGLRVTLPRDRRPREVALAVAA